MYTTTEFELGYKPVKKGKIGIRNEYFGKTFTQKSEERLLIWKEALFFRKWVSPLTSVVPLLRGGGQLTDVCCVGSCCCEIKTPARWVPVPPDHCPPPDRSPSRTSATLCPPRRARGSPAAPQTRWGPGWGCLGLFGAHPPSIAVARQHSSSSSCWQRVHVEHSLLGKIK